MIKSRFGYKTPIPTISNTKGQTKSISFKDGVDSYKDNDDLKITELSAAYDARFIRIGKYRTRKGLDRNSIPIGEAVNVQNNSVTGASTYTFNGSQAVAQPLTIASDGRITRVEVNLKTTATSAGVIMVELYTGSTQPTTLLGRSTIRSTDVTGTATYVPCYFINAPLVTNGTKVWVVVKGQSSTVKDYLISTTTTATNALISSTAGAAWSSSTYSANVKIYTSTSGGVKGLTRTYRPSGQKATYFVFADTLYGVSEVDGTTTVIKSGMAGGAINYRFQMVQDALYWVNGLEKPYKYDFTTVTQINASPYTPSNIMEHVGIMFFIDANDKTRLFYTNFALYDTFTSTDFIYVPAPKSYDSLTAMAKLNGVLFLFANRNKMQLFGQDNDTFSLSEASDQRGTFSQESVVYDANYIYHADEEGVHQFNGTESRNLAESFLEDYLSIPDKSGIRLELYENRLYVFYPPVGSTVNSECFVYNILLNKYEAKDKNTYVGRTFGRYAQDNAFLQASNLVGAVYFSERDSNDYHNLGGQLEYELDTSYSHFDTPGQLKTSPMWRPSLGSVSGQYSMKVGYAKDLIPTPTYTDVDISGSGPRLNTGVLLNTGVRLGGISLIEPTNVLIPGEFKRLQRRYQHIAAREPVEFDSEVLTIQTQRLY